MRRLVEIRVQAGRWLWSWLLIGTAYANATNNEALTDWDLLDDYRTHSVGLRLGDGDSVTWGADATLMLPGYFELAADYLRTDSSSGLGDEPLTSYLVALRSDQLATWSAQLSIAEAGNEDSLLTRDYGLGVQYRAEHWQLGIAYLHGEVELRTQPLANRVAPRRFELDRDGVQATLTVFGERWHWSVDVLDHSYERSIDLNPTSLALLRRLGFNTFTQVFGLLDWSATTELGWLHNQHSLRLGYSRNALELTNETGQIPYIGWDYTLNDRFSFGLLGAAGLDDSEHYAELSARMRF